MRKRARSLILKNQFKHSCLFFVAKIGFIAKNFRKIYKDICIAKTLEYRHIQVVMENNLVYG